MIIPNTFNHLKAWYVGISIVDYKDGPRASVLGLGSSNIQVNP